MCGFFFFSFQKLFFHSFFLLSTPVIIFPFELLLSSIIILVSFFFMYLRIHTLLQYITITFVNFFVFCSFFFHFEHTFHCPCCVCFLSFQNYYKKIYNFHGSDTRVWRFTRIVGVLLLLLRLKDKIGVIKKKKKKATSEFTIEGRKRGKYVKLFVENGVSDCARNSVCNGAFWNSFHSKIGLVR